jgi:hypothetical protein
MDFQVQLVHKVRREQQVRQEAVQVVHKVRREQQDPQVVVQPEHKVRLEQVVHGVRQERLVRKEQVVHAVRLEQLVRRKLPTFQSLLGHCKQQLLLDLHRQVDLGCLKRGSRIKFQFSFGELLTVRILPMG